MHHITKDMKIGFDGKRALRNMTGLGNYSRLVVESLAETYPQLQLTLYSPRDGDNERLHKIRELSNVSVRLPGKGEAPLGGSLWRTRGMTHLFQTDGIDLFHGLSNELPLNISKSGIPSVVTMHDVIYRRMPECYNLPDRIIYDFKYGRACRHATRVIAVSERTKRDVMEFYGIGEEKIDIVYQGCDDIFRQRLDNAQIAGIKKKYDIRTPYIIQVGSIEKRKNAMVSVKALSRLPQEYSLLLVGRRTPYLDKVMREADTLGVRGRVKVLDGVAFKDLPALYQGAAAAVYPSRYEGFGIPVLEALNSRIPCIAAKGSCLEEAGGDSGIYIDPDDPRGLTEALDVVINEETVRTAMIEEGLRHAARFSNADIPARLMAVYRQAIEDHSRGCR